MAPAYGSESAPAAVVTGQSANASSQGRSGGGKEGGHSGEPKLVSTKKPDDENEQAGENTDTIEVDNLDPVDKGSGTLPDTGNFTKEDDDGMETGESPEMNFPLLDVEPNSITSKNTDDFVVNLAKRAPKPKIDFEQLAYETVVARLAGHKKAYNSSEYGKLAPSVEIHMAKKKNNKRIWKMDAESLQDTLAESSAGFRKSNAALANDFKRNMRTFVLPNSHYHGGPTMFKRGLNQFRNKAIRQKALDPNPESVDVAVQNSRHAFVLNDTVLYGNDNVRLQFKSNFNHNNIVPDSTAAGDIPPPTTWFGVQNMPGISNAGASRQAGFSRTTDSRGTETTNICAQDPSISAQTDYSAKSGVYISSAFPQQYNTQSQFSFAPSQPNTGTYAVHATSSSTNYATVGGPAPMAPGGTAPQTMGL